MTAGYDQAWARRRFGRRTFLRAAGGSTAALALGATGALALAHRRAAPTVGSTAASARWPPIRVVCSTCLNDSELAGPCFSPDGRFFFVNIQEPGLTFVIWGPFPRANAARQRRMAVAAPPALLAPQLTGELAEAAVKHGLTPLEAAAFDRLGVPLL